MARWWAASAASVALSVILTGCGGPPPPAADCPESCPCDAPVTQIGSGIADYAFCGTRFVAIQNPSWLANFRAIEARNDDVFVATQPPAGPAKEAVLGLVKALVGTEEVSGHTEFTDFQQTPGGPEKMSTTNRRLIGTHVDFNNLPTSVLQTPSGETPRKVIALVREPKEYLVAAALFKNGPESDIPVRVDAHVDASKPGGELDAAYGGFAGWSNSYAAGMDSTGGPLVLLLSQDRLADANKAAAEVERLATFLNVTVGDPAIVDDAVSRAAGGLGDVSKMPAEYVTKSDQTFVAPAVDQRVVDLYTDAGEREQASVAIV